ncbi:MAG: tRNA (N6-threonylcarbamoyladenosine(37)-N6)-methyltransferase TrmO [Lachnospiraceae bacterium]|nr:tRNA (N6-threonylcarbamoyladenosine(37)-N6)-methyltransferase TrmO [Lachnospiraceae bacterium]
MQDITIRPIARIHTDFSSKFGIPRQSNLVEELEGAIVFENEFRNPDAVRGLSDFTYIWLIFGFSECERDNWKATVNPPKLDKNERKGVFATRSPYRPNPLGLSSVKLISVEEDEKNGPIIRVSGADLLDGTPIYDIKPYIPYGDSHPEAANGFAEDYVNDRLEVLVPENLIEMIPTEKRKALVNVLSLDPRPSYMNYADRRYGIEFAGFDVRFYVNVKKLEVCEIERLNDV